MYKQQSDCHHKLCFPAPCLRFRNSHTQAGNFPGFHISLDIWRCKSNTCIQSAINESANQLPGLSLLNLYWVSNLNEDLACTLKSNRPMMKRFQDFKVARKWKSNPTIPRNRLFRSVCRAARCFPDGYCRTP